MAIVVYILVGLLIVIFIKEVVQTIIDIKNKKYVIKITVLDIVVCLIVGATIVDLIFTRSYFLGLNTTFFTRVAKIIELLFVILLLLFVRRLGDSFKREKDEKSDNDKEEK